MAEHEEYVTDLLDRCVGERYKHENIGFAVGILLAVWLVLIATYY